MWAIVGGSGFERFEDVENLGDLDRRTPFGLTSNGFKRIRLAGQETLFLPRHGQHHDLLPSEINYRANIFALKRFGAKAILSFSAVGSLREELKPGDMVIPTQYLDRTKGLRPASFCGAGVIGHVSLAHAVCASLAAATAALARQSDWQTHMDKTYVCIEGPHFSSVAESHQYRDMKADIIGMTNFPEYALAREAGMSYLPCCFVTDYDCWDTGRPHVTLDSVLTVMRQNNQKALKLARQIVSQTVPLYDSCGCAGQGLKTSLLTPLERVPPETREWLDVLLS